MLRRGHRGRRCRPTLHARPGGGAPPNSPTDHLPVRLDTVAAERCGAVRTDGAGRGRPAGRSGPGRASSAPDVDSAEKPPDPVGFLKTRRHETPE